MSFLKANWDKIILVFLIVAYSITFSTLTILRHDTFSSYFDLSNMDNTLWNTLHGHFFSLRIADTYVSRLSVHADFILIFLSPLYLLWNNVRVLLITQSVFLGLGGLPTFLLAKKVLQNKLAAVCIVVVYFLNPGMEWTNMYDFHSVSLAIPLLITIFYCAYTKHWKWFIFFSFLALLTKEEISLDIMMIGLIIFFIWKQRIIGAVTSIIGLTWFIVMVFVVVPHFSPSNTHWALAMYQPVFDTQKPLFRLIHINPNSFQLFFTQRSLSYYNSLLKPFAYFPLLGFPWLVLSLPELAINVLSNNAAMEVITFHYDSGITPSLVIATVFGIKYIIAFVKKARYISVANNYLLYSACLLLVLIALRVNYHYSPLPTTPSCWCQVYNLTPEDIAFENALQHIPQDASVTASIEVRTHVNHRENVWFVPSATQSAQYIALITQNRIVGNYNPKIYENQLIPILLKNKKYKVDFKSQHFYLFQKL